MIYYLDTSLLIAVFTTEMHSTRAATWLYARAVTSLAVSRWTSVEFTSALSIKVRTRQIDLLARDRALDQFNRECAEAWFDFLILDEDFETAANWCKRHETGLRAGDALHLAIAGRNNATLCTLDRKLYDAGQTLGVQTLLV